MLLPWFHALARREQRILLIAAPLVLMLIVWLMLIQPLQQEKVRLEDQVDKRQVSLQWMKSAAVRVQAMQHRQPITTTSGSLRQLLNRVLSSEKLVTNRLQPLGENRLSVWLTDASYVAVIRTVDRLTQQRVTLEQIQLTALDASGRVNVYLTVARGASL